MVFAYLYKGHNLFVFSISAFIIAAFTTDVASLRQRQKIIPSTGFIVSWKERR
jgi:hypothetical protein